MKTTWFGFSTALQTFIQRYFSMQMLTLHCDLYEWRRVRSAHTQLLLDISGDLRRCVGSQISAISSILPIELTRSTDWSSQGASFLEKTLKFNIPENSKSKSNKRSGPLGSPLWSTNSDVWLVESGFLLIGLWSTLTLVGGLDGNRLKSVKALKLQ